MKKLYLALLLFSFSLLYLALFTHSALAQKIDTPIIDNVLDTLSIPAHSERDINGNTFSVGDQQLVFYVTKTVVEKLPGEISRNDHSIFLKDNKVRIYQGQPFFVDNGTIFETGFELLSQTQFNNSVIKFKETKLDYHIFLNEALAQIPSSVGDGDVWGGDVHWETVRAFTTGGDRSYTGVNIRVQATPGSSLFQIQRGFSAFDTSIANGYTVTSALLHFKVDVYNGSQSVQIYTGTQENTDTLVYDDFDNFGSAVSDIQSSFASGAYNSFTLSNPDTDINKNGFSKFCLRISNDYADIEPAINNYIFFYSSEQTGTADDPYLELTLSGYEPPETATSTPANCYPDEIDDMSFITACSFASTTLGIVYTNYHFPFLIWVIFAVIFLFIAKFIIVEFLIRWRNAFKK